MGEDFDDHERDDDDRQDMVVLKGLLVIHGRTEDSPEKDCF